MTFKSSYRQRYCSCSIIAKRKNYSSTTDISFINMDEAAGRINMQQGYDQIRPLSDAP